jgi:pseudomonalisin
MVMRLKRTAAGTAVGIALLCGALKAVQGQTRPEPLPGRRRITEAVDDRRTVRLLETTHPRIRRARDNGRVDSELPMDRAILTLKSSPQQEADLEAFLAQQQDPSSPHYHEWLTPQQFGERFGASAEDIDVIVNWLQTHGLRVTRVSNGRREIEFGGTAGQIEEAFRTEIHHYELNGEMHVANAIDISIPEALSQAVEGVVSFHNFARKLKIHLDRLDPNYTFPSGRHGMVPYDFATIYDLAPLWNEGFDGSGQTIAVVGRSNLNLDDVAGFRAQYGLPAKNPQVIVNGTDPGIVSIDEEGEADLDVEWSGAVAKGATVNFVVSKSTNTMDGAVLSEMYIVNNNVAPVVTTSFGFCEVMSPSTSRFYANLWQQAAAQGMSVFVAAGDSGSASCDDPSGKSGPAKGGLSVDGEASTPYNVAVGGTQFNENGADSVYWNGTNDPQNRSSAKTYIPEVVWNESGPSLGLWSGGGGVSTVHTTPSWQSGFGVPTADPGTTDQHHRYVPDVSLTAAGHDGYVILQRSSLSLVSGTSASAPAFAGIMAIINQVTNRANGNPNPSLYALAAQVPSAFHDITSGTNAVPCTAGSPNCVGGTTTGYAAGPGYDLATGWGSVDAYVFAHAFAGSTPPVVITSSSSLKSGPTGTAYTVTLTASGGTPPYQWAVTSGSSLPPGLSLSSSGVLSGTPTTSGSYSFSVTVTDSTGASATQSFQITITAGTPGGVGGSSSTSATASTYHVFPQFADGRNTDGTYYRTTLMISNPSANGSAKCTLQLRGLTVPGFGPTYSLGPSGWTIASTNGSQPFQSGFATLQCDTKVEAQLLYSYYLSNGTKLSEATVFSSPPGATAWVVADQREGAQLGLAIANDSDQSVTYTISMGGTSTPLTLGPRSSTAKFINQFLPGIPAGNLGIVQVSSSNGTASVIGLRYSGAVFTTIPESTISPALPTASTYHVFPQFADGKSPDGTYYRTTRIYLNSGSSATNCTTQLYGASTDGFTRFTASNLPPGNFVVAPTNGTQSFQAGYATLLCTSPVDAQALYSYYAADGTKLGEATVFSSPSAKTVQILADSREGAQVGLAIANDSDQSNTYTIVATDVTGAVVASTTQQLGPRTTIAKFLGQLVTLPPNYFGPVTVSSGTGTASIIGLRYTGAAFTTIPETIRP